ncbi:MAG: hypothetical protein KGJ41_01635 [Rhodospirillales bacterium]|nr:hypothetical protein [Rhodospirillales bacterium]MDE2576071.1 hypothetical protein [Rhodospirillales bacterium]
MEPVTDSAEQCLLDHQIFTALGPVCFRRAEADGTPVMVIPMGEREASVPLRALQREFAIGDESPDGRMLGLIAESLDYVSGLQLGDRLPAEVLTGEASWSPSPRHLLAASDRLRGQLAAWLDPAGRADAAGAPLADDPAARRQVQLAFEQAATALGLASSEEVVLLVEKLAGELAYIEALRDSLLGRVKLLAARLERMARQFRGDGQRLETLTQVLRLNAIGLRSLAERFDEVDAQTGEVLAALRNIESQRAFIRANRDGLYRAQRAWEPILTDWDGTGPETGEQVWLLLGRTYHFLAPRFMPVTEWLAVKPVRQVRGGARTERAMKW